MHRTVWVQPDVQPIGIASRRMLDEFGIDRVENHDPIKFGLLAQGPFLFPKMYRRCGSNNGGLLQHNAAELLTGYQPPAPETLLPKERLHNQLKAA